MRYLQNHFGLKFKDVKLKKEVINLYLQLVRKKEKTDSEKEDLRRLRGILRKPVYILDIELKNQKVKDLKKTLHLEKKPTLIELRTHFLELRQEFRKRKGSQKIETPVKSHDYYGFVVKSVAGVHFEPGQILEAQNKSNKNSPDYNKKPRRGASHFGIELEFNSNGNMSSEKNAIKKFLMDNKLGLYCNLVEDGSCGHELRVLLEEDNYEIPLKKIMDGLIKLGFACNSRCGTHVHIDMRDRDHKLVYRNLVAIQDLMYSLVPAARRKSQYCRKNTEATFDDAIAEHDRYHYANVHAFSRHKTLEIRLHHGTLNFKELHQWLKLLKKVANKKEQVYHSITNAKLFVQEFGLSGAEARSLYSRCKKMNLELTSEKLQFILEGVGGSYV